MTVIQLIPAKSQKELENHHDMIDLILEVLEAKVMLEAPLDILAAKEMNHPRKCPKDFII
jgi:hypothetical protein